MNFNYVLIVNHINNDIINIEEKKRKKKVTAYETRQCESDYPTLTLVN